MSHFVTGYFYACYRYTFLPYWYTVFYQHNMTGAPVIRPLWAEFPEDRPTFSIDNQLMIGKFGEQSFGLVNKAHLTNLI